MRVTAVRSGYDLAMSTAHLLDDLLALPEHDRAELAQALVQSLGAPGDVAADTESWERKWAAEAERRLRQVQDGSVQVVDAEVVFAELRTRLNSK